MPENVKFNNDKYAAKLGRPLITKTPPLDPTTRQIGNLSTGRFRGNGNFSDRKSLGRKPCRSRQGAGGTGTLGIDWAVIKDVFKTSESFKWVIFQRYCCFRSIICLHKLLLWSYEEWDVKKEISPRPSRCCKITWFFFCNNRRQETLLKP